MCVDMYTFKIDQSPSQGVQLREPFKNNPVSGRLEGFFSGPPDYKSSVQTTWPSSLLNIWWKIYGMMKEKPLLSPPPPFKKIPLQRMILKLLPSRNF